MPEKKPDETEPDPKEPEPPGPEDGELTVEDLEKVNGGNGHNGDVFKHKIDR
jgi:hypothetical protein